MSYLKKKQPTYIGYGYENQDIVGVIPPNTTSQLM